MSKRKKLIYWIATVWLALGMTSTGIVQLLHVDDEVAVFTELGYPLYFLTLIGIWKLLGVVAILLPRLPILKEWTYAGFFFSMSGAIFSHLAANHSLSQILPPLLLLVLTIVSWHFRPAERRIRSIKPLPSVQY